MHGGRAKIGFLVVALFAFLPAGCGDGEVVPYRPPIPAGRIEGVVGHGGVPIIATIRATRVQGVEGVGHLARYIETRPDSSGAYRLDVPEGRYVLSIRTEYRSYHYSATALSSDDKSPDTLIVVSGGPPLRADFLLSAVRAQVALPAAPDGERVRIEVYKRNSPFSWASYSSSVSGILNGMADVTITGVLPGAYRLRTTVLYSVDSWNSDGGQHFWVPGVADSTASPWIDVDPDRVTWVPVSLSGPPARIEGEVVGPSLGAGLWTSPKFTLFTPDSQVVVDPRPVAGDGRFAADVYLPGPVRVCVHQGPVEQWLGGTSFREATVFQLQSGTVVSGIRFVQSAIKLETSSSGLLMTHARVRLFDPARELPIVQIDSRYLLDQDRLFAIPNLRPGTYHLRIEPLYNGSSAWLPQWYDRAESRDTAWPITIAHEGELVTVPMVLEQGGSIRGEVRDLSFPGAAYVVYVTRKDAPVVWTRMGTMGERPRVAVYGLPEGDWKIGVWRDDYGPSAQPPIDTYWYPGTTDWANAASLQIRGTAEITGIVLTLP